MAAPEPVVGGRAGELGPAAGFPTRGQQRLDALQQQEQSAIAQALRDVGGSSEQGAGAAIIDTAGGEGAVSGDFIRAKADRAVQEGDRLTAVARELAKVRAPGNLVNEEGLRRADLTERIGSSGATNRAHAQAASLDAENVEAPFWGQLGKMAAQAGAMWAGGAGGGATSSPYALSGSGATLGAQPTTGFWGNSARIRFGG